MGWTPREHLCFPVEEHIMERDRSHRVIHGQNPALRWTHPGRESSWSHKGLFHSLCSPFLTHVLHTKGGHGQPCMEKGKVWGAFPISLSFPSFFLLFISIYLFLSIHSTPPKIPEGRSATESSWVSLMILRDGTILPELLPNICHLLLPLGKHKRSEFSLPKTPKDFCTEKTLWCSPGCPTVPQPPPLHPHSINPLWHHFLSLPGPNLPEQDLS